MAKKRKPVLLTLQHVRTHPRGDTKKTYTLENRALPSKDVSKNKKPHNTLLMRSRLPTRIDRVYMLIAKALPRPKDKPKDKATDQDKKEESHSHETDGNKDEF